MIAATFTVKGQSNQIIGRIITHSTSTQTMVWSESDQKHVYFTDRERYLEDNLIEINLDSRQASGKIKITNIGDGEVYTFNIYNYEFRPDQHGEGLIYDSMVIDCIEASSGTKAKIIYLSYQDSSFRAVSVFMPSEQMVVHMDTEK